MSQADAINISAAEVPDWLQLVIDTPGPSLVTPPQEEPDKIQGVPYEFLEEGFGRYFEPSVVRLGPITKTVFRGLIHDRISKEDWKMKAVKQLAEKVKGEVSIEQVYERVEKKLLSARNCYSYAISKDFEDDLEWCKMMFLDGCFVVQFTLDYILASDSLWWGPSLNMKKDDRDLVLRELLLYENQLPFEVLDALADAFRCKEDFHNSLTWMLLEMPFMLTTSSVPAPTFLDYIESCLPIKFRQRWWRKNFDQFIDRRRQWRGEDRAPAHLLQYYSDLLIFFLKKNYGDENNVFVDDDDDDDDDDERNLLGTFLFGTEGAPRPHSTVTELKKVGIKCSGTTFLSDISFYSYMLSGKLFLPQLIFDGWRKNLILNLAAYEFSCSPKYRSSGISSYLSSMGTFIHGEEDVKELRARGLVQLNHKDYDDHAVVEFFRYITAHHEPNRKVIRHVKRQISTYCKSKRLPLRVAYAEFKQRYFSGPWNFLVFLAVIFTVSMTIIQTVLTGIQTFKKD